MNFQFSKAGPLSVVALTVVALLGLQACSSTLEEREEKGKPFPLPDFERKISAKVVWRKKIGGGQGKLYNRLSLVALDNGVCAAAVGGSIACYNSDGKKLWKKNVGVNLLAGVGIAGNLALLVSEDGELIALDKESGDQRWTKDLNREVLAPPTGNDEVMVVQNSEGLVFALDSEGNDLWEFRSDEPLLTLRGTAAPVVDRKEVFTGFANGKVVSLSLDNGVPQWDQLVAIAKGTAEIGRIIDVDASPLLIDDAVYAASYNGNMFKFLRKTGRPLWRTELSTFHPLANGFGNIYAVDEKSRVLAVDVNRGEQRWENGLLLNRGLGAPQEFSGYLFSLDDKGYLHVFSQVDGTIVGRLKVSGSGTRVPMLTDGDHLYLYSNGGDLVAVQLR